MAESNGVKDKSLDNLVPRNACFLWLAGAGTQKTPVTRLISFHLLMTCEVNQTDICFQRFFS